MCWMRARREAYHDRDNWEENPVAVGGACQLESHNRFTRGYIQ
jgi:hypothetical protein